MRTVAVSGRARTELADRSQEVEGTMNVSARIRPYRRIARASVDRLVRRGGIRSSIRAASAVTLPLALLLPTAPWATSAFAATPSNPAVELMPGLRSSDLLDGPVLAAGRLLNDAGSPTTGRVVAIVWPTNATLGALRDGDPVKTMAIAQDVADTDGSFVLRVDPDVPLGEYTEVNGTINIDIIGRTTNARAVFSTSRVLRVGARPAWVQPNTRDTSSEALPDEIRLVAANQSSSGLAPETAPLPAKDKAGLCGADTVKATYDQRWVALGETYPGPNAKAKFTYEVTSTSTVGVGYSLTGAYGSYNQSGTSEVSSTTKIIWPDRLPNTKWLHKTTYQYKKYEIKDGGYCTERWYQVRATVYQGGVDSYQIVGPPSAPHCSYVGGPVVIEKNTGTAINWSNGVTLGAAIGIDVSAKTGFNTKSLIKFTFSRAGWLCGSNASYPSAAQVVGK